uniref:Uncharacterized protein n=1 Tax=Arsenophonus endosymbiont of Trialeurodes vaporariorum TaxID=235567 RepID=A0A3B0LZ86_9GAMM
MKFEELPQNIQLIAANLLGELMKMSLPEKEQTKDLAYSIKSAFISLYESD